MQTTGQRVKNNSSYTRVNPQAASQIHGHKNTATLTSASKMNKLLTRIAILSDKNIILTNFTWPDENLLVK